MSELISKAVSTDRESKHIEFKGEFDPESRPQWCEIAKDIVAIANSGGGVIVFGLESDGTISGKDVSSLARCDPATVADKIKGFTGSADLRVEIESVNKEGHALVAFLISPASIPMVFEKAGNYAAQSGTKSAFAQGTLYFRHGAKSEPAVAADLVSAFQRYSRQEKKSWLSGVRKVTMAPPGSTIVAVASRNSNPSTAHVPVANVRTVNDRKATPVFLTRDAQLATGSFLHEQVSPALFEEINNVVDANRVLARGQRKFFFGPSIYYRIYGDRRHVTFSPTDFELLFEAAIKEFYAPGLFWAVKLPVPAVAKILAKIIIEPRQPSVHYLMRIAVMLGADFSAWLFEKWKVKWHSKIQKPHFYDAFVEMRKKLTASNGAILASRLKKNWHLDVVEESGAKLEDLLVDSSRSERILSRVCVQAFEENATNSTTRELARGFDYLVHAQELLAKAPSLSKAVIKAVGDQEVQDVADETSAREEFP